MCAARDMNLDTKKVA
ncbi:hypothetical protein PDE_00739 [Penicillium oxalicum 114-2]|uniref:Uncharacterized protein n=1 Tax=Penicillium oxalicum (strain 114-2 / CGMCC 5302) TaxID=933388 RepID=S8AJ58_PENO1|nr:hypothetical protein PDE_00739 [Penicillium oxalicum 114-2]